MLSFVFSLKNSMFDYLFFLIIKLKAFVQYISRDFDSSFFCSPPTCLFSRVSNDFQFEYLLDLKKTCLSREAMDQLDFFSF